MVPPDRRASAIGIVVWGATVGSVIGPTLVPISADLARPGRAAGCSPAPYLVPIVFVGLAAILSFALLRPDPYQLADDASRRPRTRTRAERRADRARSCAGPGVAAAIIALVVGQFVMVLIMTMTPLHMTEHGHDLDGGRHRAVRATRSGCSRCRPSRAG